MCSYSMQSVLNAHTIAKPWGAVLQGFYAKEKATRKLVDCPHCKVGGKERERERKRKRKGKGKGGGGEGLGDWSEGKRRSRLCEAAPSSIAVVEYSSIIVSHFLTFDGVFFCTG